MGDDIQPLVRQCKAKSKRTRKRCQRLAMAGKKVCYHHGGASPGAPKGNQNAFKHGRRSAKAVAERKAVNQLILNVKQLIGQI
ncbi:hypothetical protein [Desulfosediminicola flagellatus]|uniref:hypothetical protein n=1 Tax=Desulfosediminicola flagellatus TaxID=2569541 RepID=UPI0010ABA58F|nr:hypothetical protein [Desulfosediminicola flagellatus]